MRENVDMGISSEAGGKVDPDDTDKAIIDKVGQIETKKTVDESDDESDDVEIGDEHVPHVDVLLWDEDRVNDDANVSSTRKDSDEGQKRSCYSTLASAVDLFKYLYSFALLIFSVVVVMTAMFTKQTIGTAEKGIHPVLAFFIFWFLICWLAMMEGGQGCLVGLQPVEKDLYRESHPRTWKNTILVHRGDNMMERFIVGRQFLVVLVVFVSNLMSSAVDGASVFGMPNVVNEIFLESGVALILTTIVLGQLTAQVNAADCMLDFINNYFMLYFVTYVSLVIEFSGILHSVYLVQIFFSKLTATPIQSSDEDQDRTLLQKIFFWGRILLSVGLLSFAFAVTLAALFDGNTTMWDGVPPYISTIIFFLLMCFVGMMEGLQIALFAVVKMPLESEFKDQHPMAYKNCTLTFRGQNLQAFLIGRQICVTICMFVVARIATLDYSSDAEQDGDNNVFGVSDSIQENVFDTGLLGALITTIVGSLVWRVVASSFPVAFLSNPLITLIIRLCLLLEASGLCSAAWVLARYHKKLVGYERDEVHLTLLRRQAQQAKDNDEEQGDATEHPQLISSSFSSP